MIYLRVSRHLNFRGNSLVWSLEDEKEEKKKEEEEDVSTIALVVLW